MSAKAGKGVPLGLPSRFPDATRAPEIAGSSANPSADVRFATEGWEVQILSPRPIKDPREVRFPGKSDLFLFRPAICRQSGRSLGSDRVTVTSKPVIRIIENTPELSDHQSASTFQRRHSSCRWRPPAGMN